MAETTPAEFQNQILLDQIAINSKQHAVQVAEMSLKHALAVQELRQELSQVQAQLGEAVTKLAEKNESSAEVDNPEDESVPD